MYHRGTWPGIVIDELSYLTMLANNAEGIDDRTLRPIVRRVTSEPIRRRVTDKIPCGEPYATRYSLLTDYTHDASNFVPFCLIATTNLTDLLDETQQWL